MSINWSAVRFASLISVGLLLPVQPVSAAGPYSEGWDGGDTNGWIPSTTSSVVVNDGTDGNPAGSLAVRRLLADPIFDTGATTELAALSGDYTGSQAWMLSFDAKYDTGDFADTWVRFRYQDSTFNGWHKDVSDIFTNAWQSHSVMFDPTWSNAEAIANGWMDETAGTVSWQQLMTDVYHPEIRFILGDQNSALAHIDNVNLKAVPEPGAVALTCIGLVACLRFARQRS
ncbi:MAG: hypothetical protein KDB27_04380 [Planctomycetales bacterium]|nr:hypothetical protein [Planctomycetales bacterium]